MMDDKTELVVHIYNIYKVLIWKENGRSCFSLFKFVAVLLSEMHLKCMYSSNGMNGHMQCLHV